MGVAAGVALGIGPTGRKIVLGLLGLLVFLYYIVPLLKSGSHRYIVLSRIERCLEDRLKLYNIKIASQNAFVYHVPPIKDQKEKYFLPYIGNGYIGISLDGSRGVWLKGERGLDIATDYNPIVIFEIKGYDIKEAIVLDIIDGQIVKHTCFQQRTVKLASCISLKQTLYIHRTRPGLLIQEVSFYNPTDNNIEVSVSQDSLSSWSTESNNIENINDPSQLDADSEASWKVGSKLLANQVLLTVSSRQFSPTGILELPAKRSVSRHSLTIFDYAAMEHAGEGEMVTKKTVRDRKAHTVKTVKSVLSNSGEDLSAQHKMAWHQAPPSTGYRIVYPVRGLGLGCYPTELWQSGFSISDSKAPDSLNSDVINSTLYYILSHVPSTLQQVISKIKDRKAAVSYLNNPGACYHNRHHTLQFSALWQIGETVETMNTGVDTHLHSLEQYGCSNYIKAGAEGVLQAVLLSLGGLSFRTSDDKILHLEFNVDPADLHRDYQFTNLRYGELTLLNVSVIVDESNYAVLHVSSSASNFYASDAGLSPPVKLSKETITLPVKLTKPLTAILYVSNDKQYLLGLRKIVHHVEEPVLAPAQDHRVLARHKHGHSYGGLPVIFWVMLALLILIFHFFLFKMVFNELCQSDYGGTYFRRRAFS